MKSQDFTYAVSRIRMKETKLLSRKDIERLISQNDYQSVLRTLAELDFGGDNNSDADDILLAEQNKLWSLMAELVEDMSVFDIFRFQNDYHNLKVCVKSVYSNTSPDSMFVSGGTIDAKDLYEKVKNRDYKELPELLGDTAAKSFDILLKTGDGQLCDAVIDNASLKAVALFAAQSQDEVIKDYAELYVDSANIKIAVRGSKLNKSYEFFRKSMAASENLNIELLARSAVKGFDEICSYLATTKYKDAVEYIKTSMSAFEKWCDDLLISGMKKQKSEPFTIGPLIAYILAKQNEIKVVRLILIAKLNSLDDAKINERIREMYV
ncbi:MAG: V-type ATPase subunit [Clostridia bacterium]|nr:V-type ATPase subunit [Clostridia bacterium]